MIIEFIPYNAEIAKIKARIGRLECWWVFGKKEEFYPPYRKHLFGSWFWRNKNIND